MIGRDDRLAFETYEMEWKYEDFQLDATGMQAYPWKIDFTFGERDVEGAFEFLPRKVLELDDLLKDARVPSWAERIIGEVIAQPIYFRLESDYDGEIDFGGDVMKVSGDTIIEYMISSLRRGQVPEEVEYRHFLKPPKLAGLKSPE